MGGGKRAVLLLSWHCCNIQTQLSLSLQYAFGIMVYEVFSRTEPYSGEVSLIIFGKVISFSFAGLNAFH